MCTPHVRSRTTRDRPWSIAEGRTDARGPGFDALARVLLCRRHLAKRQELKQSVTGGLVGSFSSPRTAAGQLCLPVTSRVLETTGAQPASCAKLYRRGGKLKIKPTKAWSMGVALALAVSTTGVSFAQNSADGRSPCASVTDDKSRLQCYDAQEALKRRGSTPNAAARPALPAPAAASRSSRSRSRCPSRTVAAA